MSEGQAFWCFSLAFYERPGVPGALIALQDRDGFDVNLVLFALWLGISGRQPLDGDALAAAERAAGTLRREMIETHAQSAPKAPATIPTATSSGGAKG